MSTPLEVAHHDVAVGSAHILWIDTPMVRDAKRDLPAFDESFSTLPGPLKNTLTVEECVDAFVDGIANRKRRVNVPGWVGAIGWFKGLLTSAICDLATLPKVPQLLARMDAEAARLGRWTSARNVIVEPARPQSVSVGED